MLCPAIALTLANQTPRLRLETNKGVLTVSAVADDILRIDFAPDGQTSQPTVMLDPRGLRTSTPTGEIADNVLTTHSLRATLTRSDLKIADNQGHRLLAIPIPDSHDITVRHDATENLYGMRSYPVEWGKPAVPFENGLLRNNGAHIAAATQGDGGAPLAYTTRWGMLVDSIDGDFATGGDGITFRNGSRKDLEAYIVLGPPKRTIAAVTALSGRPPMPPKWSVGFMNSEWGTDQKEVTDIVAEYRRRQLPLDAFIFDFDFKAWGEDDYGEFRWNSTNGAGNVGPNKYPDGASGKFAKEMAAKGVKFVGIMKPRVLTQNTAGQKTKAAEDADAHLWWLPGRKPYNEYFSHRPANDIDFTTPEARQWYWKHSEPLFKSGIVGWWNDETDDNYPSLGFFQMQQALYEGQRSVSNERVFSLNRNFYLGAQRYGFGLWSGDIGTGFGVMAAQRQRLLTAVGIAEPHWSMDTGGFGGHPSSEVYARWMEFAAVVPIMRVHGTFNEQRQPWVYGPIAEAAAKKALEFRYAMLPSFYSWEREAHDTGVGVVRPMHWEFPDDPACANRTDEWMLGESLLVSPVVDDHTGHSVYLPTGRWIAYDLSQVFDGGRLAILPTDRKRWSDMPMFVRSGSILATSPVRQFVGERQIDKITLDIYPDPSRPARFTVYDDDGSTYAYEHGRSFSQGLTATLGGDGHLHVHFDRPTGSYRSPIRQYELRVHDLAMPAKVKTQTITRPTTKQDVAVTLE